jgi:nicotinamide-nucleotide adenylyltransferase
VRGLFVGRFQPFHKGHLGVVRQILEECDDVIIVIASAQFNYLEKDPFTAGERMWMIHEALKEERIDFERVYITSIPNEPNNAKWVAHLKSLVPPLDVVYTANPLAIRLLRDAGLKVKTPEFAQREQYNGTRIRDRLLKGKDWKDDLPLAVADIIEKIGGVDRIKSVATSEAMPLLW